MKTTLKSWAALGLGTAFLGTTLVACGGVEHGEAGEGGEHHGMPGTAAISGEFGEGEGGEGEGGEGEGGEGHAAIDTLPVENRVAFMAGHVEAGLALYKAGELEMAAPHLMHPVSETHADERAGLDALGFDASLFETVSKALESGTSATEIEPQLAAAKANMVLVSKAAGGDPVKVIQFLMDTIIEEYSIAITDGKVTDPGEYQDAYGFAIAAKEQASLINPSIEGLSEELDTLIAFWPVDAPVPPADPQPVGKIIAQTSKIRFLLPRR